MAEGLLEGVLGGEEEKVDSTDSGPEPFAAAVAATLVHQSPAVAAKTAAFFEKQVEVLEIQKKNLQAEYEFFEAEWTPRLLALRLRAAFQVFFALFAGVIGLGLAIVIYEAVESRSVVVDPFSVPPSLEQKGLTGRVVAAGLLDVLSKIQVATRSSAAHPSVVSAWYNDVTIEVPEAGISIGQLERVIRTRFGHDQHIEGELVLADKGGYALTVRGNGIPSSTFIDPSGDLASLLKQAGEYVYGQSQPGLWAWYLGDNGRSAEAINFSQNMFQSASLVQRPFILNAWANAIVNQAMDNADERALDLYREAVRLDSSYLIPLNNIMQMLTNLGREEEVIPVGKQLIKAAGGRPGRADENLYQYLDTAEWNLQALRAGFVDDMASHGGLGSITSSNGPEGLNVAEIDILLHDLDAAKSRLLTTRYDDKSAPDRFAAALARGLLAAELGNSAEATQEMDAMLAAFKDPVVFAASTSAICFALPVFDAAGQDGRVDAVFAAIGSLRFVDCTRFKADILDRHGNWPAAKEWYAKAVELAPSLPAGYYSWGLALARHGDLEAAAAKFKDANQRGPHWADPLKAWADVLLKQGKTKAALEKYDAALKYAPAWKQLKQARAKLAVGGAWRADAIDLRIHRSYAKVVI
jgi:tetratricopeptide (TPR) repeat protein